MNNFNIIQIGGHFIHLAPSARVKIIIAIETNSRPSNLFKVPERPNTPGAGLEELSRYPTHRVHSPASAVNGLCTAELAVCVSIK
jgi:hypothetical protein